MKISQLKDQLTAIEDTVSDDELVTIALNGFASSWYPFVLEAGSSTWASSTVISSNHDEDPKEARPRNDVKGFWVM